MRGEGQASFTPPEDLDGEGMQVWVQGRSDRDIRNKGSTAMAEQMREGRSIPEAEALLAAFKRAQPTTGCVVLYRGMPKRYLDTVDRAFISCTSSIQVAWSYCKGSEPHVIAALLLPPGTPILSCKGISPDKEFLLLPGALIKDGQDLQVAMPKVWDWHVNQIVTHKLAGNRRASAQMVAGWSHPMFPLPASVPVTPVRYTPLPLV